MNEPSRPEHPKAEEERPSKLGKFIQTYSGFLSSFMLGVAGLIATSIWQYKQSQTAQRQAESSQQIAETKAANDWRIERAEILSKNLSVLASHGGANVEQRYGVLLSLTRGNILDPEIAVSYALELGRDNPDFMRSVLDNTANKSYQQIAHAFALTCIERYGVERDVEICKSDRDAPRSEALAQVIADDLDGASAAAKAGPLVLLRDEKQVQASLARLSWLFEPYLTKLYERRRWADITRFEESSVGARLVSAVMLCTARTGEFVTSGETAQLERFHAERRKWLTTYLQGATCDAECRGSLVDLMLTLYGEAQGDFDEALRNLVERPRGEVTQAVNHLHARLLWCQIDPDNLVLFRDKVLVPALAALVGAAKPEQSTENVVDLLALAPDPVPVTPDWKAALARLQQVCPTCYQKIFVGHRARAVAERANPPSSYRKLNFCKAAALSPDFQGATQ